LSTRLRHGLQQGLIELVIAASALHLLIRAVRDQVLPNLATGAL
jgi:hypothetical protein